MASLPRRAFIVVASLAVLVLGCRRKHVPVESEPELGYPTCGDAGSEPGIGVAHGSLRAGPISADRSVVERFDLRRTTCGFIFTSRQEWPLAIADVEVHYDAALAPIWAWKRLTSAASQRPDGNADVRRYEMRTADLFIKRRDASGEITLQKLLPGGRMAAPQGGHVGAVVSDEAHAKLWPEIGAWLRQHDQ